MDKTTRKEVAWIFHIWSTLSTPPFTHRLATLHNTCFSNENLFFSLTWHLGYKSLQSMKTYLWMTGFKNKKKYQKHQRLPCAIQRNLQTEFKENKKTSESLIPIGTRVFTRNRISRRNKYRIHGVPFRTKLWYILVILV